MIEPDSFEDMIDEKEEEKNQRRENVEMTMVVVGREKMFQLTV